MESRWVFAFDAAAGLGRELLGGKGAALAEMTAAGLPVPPGFTITTAACVAFLRAGGTFPEGLWDEVLDHLRRLEAREGRRLGDPADPLLVSVRSGAAVSMPGMMDTVLNLGLGDAAAEGLARVTGDARFALDSYRRLLQMFGDVVLGVPHAAFEERLAARRRAAGAGSDAELGPDDLRALVAAYKDLIRQVAGREFPQDPLEQLELAVRAVFRSWQNERAAVYRRLHGVPDDLGTAVNVQRMVFGNRGPTSGTGVLFTRDPSTGAPELVGEYLANAQGEDVVAGIRTPAPIAALRALQPAVYEQLRAVAERLEAHYRDVQDIEFTVEDGRLFLLQTRSAKRTARAALRIAHDLCREGRIGRDEALLRVAPEDLARLLHPALDLSGAPEPAARGLPASPGAAVGEVCFDPDAAEQLARQGRAVVLVRPETTPDDIHGIAAARGVLTARGGLTCHAAIVTRGMGKPCIVGCEGLQVDVAAGVARLGGRLLRAGEVISLDGGSGAVYLGELPLRAPEPGAEFATFLAWADEARGAFGVRANADTPDDARRARQLGAEGIGLVRTEHMFMAPERLPVVQAMVLAETEAERTRALAELLPMQEEDFVGIFREMAGLPVTIRLLDPPLHEFLPRLDELAAEVAVLRATGADPGRLGRAEDLLRKVRALAEVNPMLGHRGSRLAVTWPAIYEMQCRAIFRAARRHAAAHGAPVRPEIMFPLIGLAAEMAAMRALCARVAAEEAQGLDYAVGACIEVPRGCLVAGAIAGHAEFFSYGTNDLTQTTFGFSRDDAEAKFLHAYLHGGLIPANPFETLDPDGVGELIAVGNQRGRAVRPDLKIGVCGEQAGDPASIALLLRLGCDYVSCSPPRVPLARLAAAQAALRARR
jgi:pyruvate,orthophosphate dikinase